MKNHVSLLFEKSEQQILRNLELSKLKMADKSADVISLWAASTAISVAVFLFFILMSVGISLYLGFLFGAWHLGFFAFAAFYACVGILLFLFRKSWIILPIRKKIIYKLMNSSNT